MKIMTPTDLRKDQYQSLKWVNEKHDIIMIHNIRHSENDAVLMSKSDYTELVKKVNE